MKIVYQYQPSGGSPAHSREVFWLKPKNKSQWTDLDRLSFMLRDQGIKCGWCQFNDMVLIEFPTK